MAYPPTLPPATRVNTTPSFDNHPSDHNALVNALASIIAELGSNPSGASADLTALLATMTPIGAITAFAGSAVPTNWMMCDGSPLSRATNSALFGVIGTTYGAPDGLTFNLPNLVGRFPMGGTALNTTGGTRDNSIPPHNHNMDHEHSFDPASAAVTGGFGVQGEPSGWLTGGADPPGILFSNTAGVARSPAGWFSKALATDAAGGTTTGNTKPTTDLANGNVPVADANLPPYIILRYIIKAA